MTPSEKALLARRVQRAQRVVREIEKEPDDQRRRLDCLFR